MFMSPERRLCQDVDKVLGYSAYGGLYHENEESGSWPFRNSLFTWSVERMCPYDSNFVTPGT